MELTSTTLTITIKSKGKLSKQQKEALKIALENTAVTTLTVANKVRTIGDDPGDTPFKAEVD